VVFVFAFILAILLAYYLAEPLTRKPESPPAPPGNSPDNDGVEDERAILIQDLKDLELDYAGGKIPESEYVVRKEQLLARLTALPEKPISRGS